MLKSWVSLKEWFAGFWASLLQEGSEAWNMLELSAERSLNYAKKAASLGWFDLGAANQQADENYTARQNEATTKAQSRRSQASTNASEARGLLDANNKADQDAWSRTLAAFGAEVENAAQRYKQASQEQVDAAKKTLRSTIDAIPIAPGAAPSSPPVLTGPDPADLFDADAIAEQVSRVLDGTKQAEDVANPKQQTLGSFDSVALSRGLAGSPEKETAKNTAEMVKHTKRTKELIETMRGGGLAFA